MAVYPRKKPTPPRPTKPVALIPKPRTTTGAITQLPVPKPKPAAPRATSPARAPAATVGAPAAPPRTTPIPVPTLENVSSRIASGASYGSTLSDINRQLRQLSSTFGGAPSFTQFGYTPASGLNYSDPANLANYGTDTSSTVANDAYAGGKPPVGSQVEVLGRNLENLQRDINNNSLGLGNWFSSVHQQNLGQAQSDYDANMAQAKRAYDDAVAALINQLTGAQGTRNTDIRNSILGDISAAAASTPQPEQTTPAAVNPAGAVNLAQAYILNPQQPFNVHGPRGEKAVWVGGKPYYRRESDGKMIKLF